MASLEFKDVKQALMKIPGVQAVGNNSSGERLSVKVYFSDRESLDAANLPNEFEGYQVDTVVGGMFNSI